MRVIAEYIEREPLQKLFNEVSTSLLCKKELVKDTEHMVRAFLMVTEMIQDAPAADVAPVQKWISVKDRLPEPEQEVFVCVRSKISNYSYVCCAMHVPENWYRQSSVFCWDFECYDEYDEEQDDYIVKQGWYESIHNLDDYSVVGIEDIVTHWMPSPEPPKEE